MTAVNIYILKGPHSANPRLSHLVSGNKSATPFKTPTGFMFLHNCHPAQEEQSLQLTSDAAVLAKEDGQCAAGLCSLPEHSQNLNISFYFTGLY
jgi:hypothetical protein